MASPEYHRFIEKVRARPKPATPPAIEEQRAEFEKIASRPSPPVIIP